MLKLKTPIALLFNCIKRKTIGMPWEEHAYGSF